MTTGDLHEIAPNLVVIEGHHPHAMWEDPDLPTIAAYRGERTLYLFDTGAGPEQRAALLRVAEQLRRRRGGAAAQQPSLDRGASRPTTTTR